MCDMLFAGHCYSNLDTTNSPSNPGPICTISLSSTLENTCPLSLVYSGEAKVFSKRSSFLLLQAANSSTDCCYGLLPSNLFMLFSQPLQIKIPLIFQSLTTWPPSLISSTQVKSFDVLSHLYYDICVKVLWVSLFPHMGWGAP